MTFTIRLPVPPSTNALFTTFHNGRGIERAKTKAYKAWITAAGWAINTQRPKPIKGRVNVWVGIPRNNRRDLDNHLKAIFDLLVGMSLIEDDRKIERIAAVWHNEPEAHVEVTAA